MIQQRNDNCTCRPDKIPTPLLYKPQRLGRVEAVKHNNGHAGQRSYGKVSDQAGDVEERRYADDDITAVKLHPLLIEGRIKNNITMRVHRPLCSASCARSVGKKGYICRCKGGSLNVCSIKLRQEFEHIQRFIEPLLAGGSK